MHDNPYHVVVEKSLSAAHNSSGTTQYYTIFRPDNVFRSSPEEMVELCEATGETNIGNMVSYRPEREALHWTAAYLNLLAEAKSEGEYKTLVDVVYRQYVLPNIDAETLILKREELKNEIHTVVCAIAQGNTILPTDRNNKIKKMYKHVSDRIEQGVYTPGKWHNNETLETVVTKIMTDRLYNNLEVKEAMIRTKILDNILHAESMGAYIPLTVGNDDYRSIIINAAAGSGKSTLTERISDYIDSVGRNSFDASVITRDIFRLVLLDNPGEILQETGSVAPFSSDEEVCVTQKTVEAYKDIQQKKGAVPLSIVEKGSPYASAITDFLFDQAHTHQTYLYFIHLPVDLALERAFERSKHADKDSDQGKFLPTKLMLQIHAGMSREFEDTIKSLTGRKVVFELLDNNVRKGELPRPIAFGNLETHEINICEPKKLKDYMAKRYINVNALSGDELYHISTQDENDLTEAIVSLSDFAELNFADPKSGLIYAKLTSGQLEIYNLNKYKEQFEGVFVNIDDIVSGTYNDCRSSARYANHNSHIITR